MGVNFRKSALLAAIILDPRVTASGLLYRQSNGTDHSISSPSPAAAISTTTSSSFVQVYYHTFISFSFQIIPTPTNDIHTTIHTSFSTLPAFFSDVDPIRSADPTSSTDLSHLTFASVLPSSQRLTESTSPASFSTTATALSSTFSQSADVSSYAAAVSRSVTAATRTIEPSGSALSSGSATDSPASRPPPTSASISSTTSSALSSSTKVSSGAQIASGLTGDQLAPNPVDHSGQSLSGRAIAGIVAGIACLAILAAAIGLYFLRRRTHEPLPQNPDVYPEEAYLYDPPIAPLPQRSLDANTAYLPPRAAMSENTHLLSPAIAAAAAGGGAAAKGRPSLDAGDLGSGSPYLADPFADQSSEPPSDWDELESKLLAATGSEQRSSVFSMQGPGTLTTRTSQLVVVNPDPVDNRLNSSGSS